MEQPIICGDDRSGTSGQMLQSKKYEPKLCKARTLDTVNSEAHYAAVIGIQITVEQALVEC